tara:strand:+ start:54 stop:329 length:276 start_codon:yes stop_codon:yes gene_type:complete
MTMNERFIVPKTDFDLGTYRELRAILDEIPDDCLDKPVIICDKLIEEQYIRDGVSYPTPNGEEFRSVRGIGFTGSGCKKLGADNMLLYVGD